MGLMNNPALSKSVEWPPRELPLGEKVMGESGYQADSWKRLRCVIYQIESKEKDLSCGLYVSQ